LHFNLELSYVALSLMLFLSHVQFSYPETIFTTFNDL
jgi:hypothetical protein